MVTANAVSLAIPSLRAEGTIFLFVLTVGREISHILKSGYEDVACLSMFCYSRWGGVENWNIRKKRVDYRQCPDKSFQRSGELHYVTFYLGLQDVKTGPKPLQELYATLGDVPYKRKKWIPGVFMDIKYPYSNIHTPTHRRFVLGLAPSILDEVSPPVIISSEWQPMEGVLPECA